MESSINRRVEKRSYEQSSVEDESDHLHESKKPKLPGLASVIVEALKVDSLQRLCSSLEPLFRRIVSEEIERALTRLGHTKLTGRSSPPKIQGPEGKTLQLQFRTKMPPHLFTGGKVEGEQGSAIHVILIDSSTGSVVQMGPESLAKLNVVVLEGDFNDENSEEWSEEHFESHQVKEREGKRPLLTGDLQVTLKEGVGTLGELSFTDNSSWIRSRKFRLGVKVALGYCEGIRVREAKTEAFAVKDHRGELYKKHYPPALHDEVWRLDRIAKDGALHKKLVQSQIVTVEDFLRVLVRDQQKLRSILGSGMSNRMWENTVEHAKTCVLGGKLYVYYSDGAHSSSTGVVFNHIYELQGLISEGQFHSLESLDDNLKMSVDALVKRAYDNWHQVIEYDGKVLNSLAVVTKNGKGPSNSPTFDNNNETNHYATLALNRQQQQQEYISPEPSLQYQPVNNTPHISQLIEYPFMRPEHNAMTLNDPQLVFSGNKDYFSVGTPMMGGSWPRSGNGMEDFFAEEIRVRSSEMLESDDMQRLLRTFGMGTAENGGYSYSIQAYDPPADHKYTHERGRGSGKAVVGWLKLKAALRWGIFIRKKAAERRAQLVELD